MSKALPSMEFSFKLDTVGKETGEHFSGDFKFVRLSLGKRGESDKLYIKLTENLALLPEDTLMFYDMVSFLRYGLVESPDWWKKSNYGVELFDSNVVSELYTKVMDFEMEWVQKVKGEDKADDKK